MSWQQMAYRAYYRIASFLTETDIAPNLQHPRQPQVKTINEADLL